ncbi:MAG: hypothetical protein JJU40_13005 [Rhodobacteraceae bacterium]|nr:hypothetical protein [Paracoccaceae bacterium]
MSRDELSFLPPEGATDTLAALVMDLGAQLHAERQARLALEEALIRRGLLSVEEVAALAGDPALLARARDGLERSMARIMRILEEAGDRTGPLRAEAPATEETG